MTEPKKGRGSAQPLDSSSFEALLHYLGPDPQAASRRYESLHHRLSRLLEWRGARYPEELADEVMNRLAKRLAKGLEVKTSDPYKYLSGIAYKVLQEEYRDAERAARMLKEAQRFSEQTTMTVDEQELERSRMDCLEMCIERLEPKNRHLVLGYYRAGGKRLSQRRRELAESLELTPQALRLRAHRIRMSLERCVRGCMAGDTPTS